MKIILSTRQTLSNFSDFEKRSTSIRTLFKHLSNIVHAFKKQKPDASSLQKKYNISKVIYYKERHPDQSCCDQNTPVKKCLVKTKAGTLPSEERTHGSYLWT